MSKKFVAGWYGIPTGSRAHYFEKMEKIHADFSGRKKPRIRPVCDLTRPFRLSELSELGDSPKCKVCERVIEARRKKEGTE